MTRDIADEIASLGRQSVGQLQGRFAEVFGEPARVANKAWLVKRIAWRLQAVAEGDLSERARLRADALARDADLRLMPPRVHSPQFGSARERSDGRDERLPAPGTVLTRRYKGKLLQVTVRSDGFAFESEVYSSLSAVAEAITGSHWNGFRFFGLARGGDR